MSNEKEDLYDKLMDGFTDFVRKGKENPYTHRTTGTCLLYFTRKKCWRSACRKQKEWLL